MHNEKIKSHIIALRRRLMYPFQKERRHVISFSHAWNGIVFAFKTQPNFRFHTIAAASVICAGVYFDIGNLEWVIIGFTIMVVLVAETINTALEQVVDLLTDTYHLNAKHAKDVAAGMVLITAVFSVFIAFMIFVPHISNLVQPLFA